MGSVCRTAALFNALVRLNQGSLRSDRILTFRAQGVW